MSAAIMPLLQTGQFEAAHSLARSKLAVDPESAEYLRAMGVLQAFGRQWDEAFESFQRALHSQPPKAEWWRDLGVALICAGAAEAALDPLESSLKLSRDPTTLIYYGEALETLGRSMDALKAYQGSVDHDPGFLSGHQHLAALYAVMGYDERALRHAGRSARLSDFDCSALHALASAYFQAGRMRSCLQTYRRAMKKNPAGEEIHSHYLFALLHDVRKTPEFMRLAHEDWFRRHCGAPAGDIEFANDAEPQRKLRVGYVACEYRSSPSAHFLLPILQTHDRSKIAVYCYQLAVDKDSVTEEYKKTADVWREVQKATPEEIRAQIVSDRIDLLVDVSGHFAPATQIVFHQRAAPVQVAFPIYPSTTGCRETDFIIADKWAAPDEYFDLNYSEKAVYRIPSGYVLYAPLTGAPAVTALPAVRNGYTTFGLFQRPAKFNDQVWKAIAGILTQTAGSRLLVHYGTKDLDESESASRQLVVAALANFGVARDRIDFVGSRRVDEHLGVISRADIALDTWPYSGHTTTCDCLWMGVPVVTLPGLSHASRVGYGLLARLDLMDWVAASSGQYVEMAAAKAGDLAGLESLRCALRPRMAESTICKPQSVVRELEEGYRWMWRRWCASAKETAGSTQSNSAS